MTERTATTTAYDLAQALLAYRGDHWYQDVADLHPALDWDATDALPVEGDALLLTVDGKAVYYDAQVGWTVVAQDTPWVVTQMAGGPGMKLARTTVTPARIAEAQGGDPASSTNSYTVMVRCPDSYDPATITADDIVNDGDITVAEWADR